MNLNARYCTLLAATTAALLFPVCTFAQAADAPVLANAPQLMAAASAPSAFAEIANARPLIAAEPVSSSSSSLDGLPDAPGSSVANAPAFAMNAPIAGGNNPAPKYAKYIAADEHAQPVNAHDKVIIGLRDLYSPLNFLAMIASAGYEQALNGSPNYGTDRGAFGERLGAAAIRESTQGLFTDSVFAPMLHMDSRYYVQGPGTGFVHRTVYAVTRVLISKTDGGRNTINAPLLLGYAASTALSTTYYPQINRNFKDSVSEYGGSLGGAAIGFFVSEFSDQFLKAVHMKK